MLREHAKALVVAQRGFEASRNNLWVGIAFAVLYLFLLFFVSHTVKWAWLIAVASLQAIFVFVWWGIVKRRLRPLD